MDAIEVRLLTLERVIVRSDLGRCIVEMRVHYREQRRPEMVFSSFAFRAHTESEEKERNKMELENPNRPGNNKATVKVLLRERAGFV